MSIVIHDYDKFDNLEKQEIDNKIWFVDDLDNRASLEFWGSEEEAIKSLGTLDSCTDCINCAYCIDCQACEECQFCEDCQSEKRESWRYSGRDYTAFTKEPKLKLEEIHKRIYEVSSQPDSLNMGRWHTCDQTHCRAGWAVVIAGEVAKELEKATDTAFTAMMIYHLSGYNISSIRFYDDNRTALRDMKKLAEG